MRPTLLLLLLSGLITAQSTTATVHFDRDLYAGGEVAWFQAYVPGLGGGRLRAEVYAPDGERLDYFFLEATGQTAARGYYRWGYDLPTGYYRLLLSALSADGEVVELGTYVRQVFQVADRAGEPVATAAASSDPSPSTLVVEASPEKLTISGLPIGSYSLSVVNQDVVGAAANGVTTQPTTSAPAYQDILFYPGTLTAVDGGGGVRTNLLPFMDVARRVPYFSKADAAGKFLLTVPVFEGRKSVQAISVDEQAFRTSVAAPRMPALQDVPPLTDLVIDYLDLSYRRRKVYQLYGTVESALQSTAITERPAAYRADKRYAVQDYKAFPDLFTFFREVAGELRYRERKGSYTARLYNAPNQRFFEETPLFIIDGQLTRDADYVARLSPADIERISFFYDNRQLRSDFPALGGGGVVMIESVRGNADVPAADAANRVTISGLLPKQSFPEAVTGVPQLSPLLLWSTGRTDASGQLEVSLPATDDPGNYVVLIVAQADGGGELLRGRGAFTVRPSR